MGPIGRGRVRVLSDPCGCFQIEIGKIKPQNKSKSRFEAFAHSRSTFLFVSFPSPCFFSLATSLGGWPGGHPVVNCGQTCGSAFPLETLGPQSPDGGTLRKHPLDAGPCVGHFKKVQRK